MTAIQPNFTIIDLLPPGAGYGDALIIVPYAQFPSRTVSILATVRSDLPNLGALLQATLKKAAPDLATEGSFESVRDFLRRRQGRLVLLANILAGFCVLAIVNSSLGLYGVIDYSARARRRELGLRMALGAKTSQILKQVLLQARWQLGCGLTTGLLAGFGLNQAMFRLMGGVSFTLLPQFATVTGITILFCLLAAGVPAWRATKINPIEVIRAD